MARIYATPADLPEQYRDDPTAPTLIRLASGLVTTAIQNARFPTDENGMPTGDDLEACQAAVVAQVSTWFSTGVDPLKGYTGKKVVVASKSTNGSSVSYVQDAALDAYLNRLAEGSRLTDAAASILGAQGLLEVWFHGPGSARMYHPVPSPDTLIDGGEG